MDAPLQAHELVRPWRTATLVATLVAAVELVLLVVAAFLLLAKPLVRAMNHQAAAAAFAPAVKKPARIVLHVAKVGKPTLTRSHTGVLVLNGNGRSGAASQAAAQLQSLGYRIRGKGNAQRSDYATTVVMYRSGFHAEALRLAHDMHVRVVGPLDGMRPSALHGGQLVVVLGAG